MPSFPRALLPRGLKLRACFGSLVLSILSRRLIQFCLFESHVLYFRDLKNGGFSGWAGKPPKENKVLLSKDAQPWISADPVYISTKNIFGAINSWKLSSALRGMTFVTSLIKVYPVPCRK